MLVTGVAKGDSVAGVTPGMHLSLSSLFGVRFDALQGPVACRRTADDRYMLERLRLGPPRWAAELRYSVIDLIWPSSRRDPRS